MRRLLLLAVSLSLVASADLAAQGSASDYQRASELGRQSAGKVTRARISPVWLPDGQLLYTVSTGPRQQELVLIDPEAPAGSRRTVLSELPALASVLGGREARLLDAAAGGDGGVQMLYDDASVLRFDPKTRAVEQLALEQADAFLLEPTTRTRSGRRGERTTLLFVNRTTDPIELLWVNGDGPGRSYGEVAPGDARSLSTYIGHVWRVHAPDSVQAQAGERPLEPIHFRTFSQAGVALLTPESWSSEEEPSVGTAESSSSRGSTTSRPRLEIMSGNLFGPVDAEPPFKVSFWTHDGTTDDTYSARVNWSPTGQAFMARQTRRAPERRRVTIVESSPRDQLQPRVLEFDYTKPGDELDYSRLKFFRLGEDGQPVAIPVDESIWGTPWRVSQQSWSADGQKARFLVNERGHQRLAYYELDVATGELRTLIDERSTTFVDYSQKTYLRVLEDRGQLLWMSERSGWNHLYLIDLETGDAQPLTQGEWVVRAVDEVREDGTLLLRVMGMEADQDPYHVHYATVSLDDGTLTRLTEGDGTHSLTWSPDGQTFIDRWSRVDQPPVHELRRRDGTLICELERGDASALLATGWQMPERFVAKGRDGQTDIWGLVYRPTNFDPNQSYPVIENIYAGPHGFHVEKSWSAHRKSREMAELGFLVVRIDGMGTNWRSKAFHDVAWKNIADAGFPDRKRWIQAWAATEPAADLSRVGIYGGSAGGQNAMRALIDHHDFYHAAVADCGCHDNRMDKIWWNEAWMGWPVDESYARSSNVDHAHRMEGDLLLIVGELDRNVDPASTMQVVDALIRADKDFEMLVIPGGGHGVAETPYGTRKRRDFFVRHLLGVEPRWREDG